MQIFAFDEKECLISSFQALKRKNYICPECQGPVRLRSGLYRRSHFYHLYTKTSCRLGIHTPLHLSVQLFFERHISGLALEVSFPSIKRIADCVWESKKIIFEIQCSPISKEEVACRMRDYSSLGYTVVWILHEKTFHKRFLCEAELFLQQSPHYFTNIDLKGNGMVYDKFSHIEKGKRITTSKPFPISVSKPIFPPFSFKERKGWPLGFKGDLLSQKDPLPREKKRRRIFSNFFRDLVEILYQ